MASFERKSYMQERGIKRIQGDMKVVLGKEEVTLETYTALAQSKTDGKFYKYVPGDADKGIIIGLYTGEKIVLTVAGKDVLGTITTQAIVGKEDIKGIDFETDFTAITQLKQSGIILVDTIDGTEEA